MGYSASGSGSAELLLGTDIVELKKVLNKALDNNGIEFDFYKVKETDFIEFWENNSHWHEEESMKFYEALAPYIVNGCANYSGEEDCYWRYVFDVDSHAWYEENGTLDYNFESYKDEELIEELEKRGYTVSKTPATFEIKIPNGVLKVEEKGAIDEYPGVFVSFQEKDSSELDIVACVEYDTYAEEIKTESYQKDCDEPNNIIVYEAY